MRVGARRAAALPRGAPFLSTAISPGVGRPAQVPALTIPRAPAATAASISDPSADLGDNHVDPRQLCDLARLEDRLDGVGLAGR
jgi:hypothetical protein